MEKLNLIDKLCKIIPICSKCSEKFNEHSIYHGFFLGNGPCCNCEALSELVPEERRFLTKKHMRLRYTTSKVNMHKN